MAMNHAARLVMFAQLSLFLCLFACFLLMPHFLFESNEGGVSNYGTYARTVIPYTIGFALCGVLTIRAAFSLPKEASYRTLQRVLLLLGTLYLLELLSTYAYKLNNTFNNVHVYISVISAAYCMAIGVWLALSIARNAVNVSLVLVQSLGFVVAGLTYLGYLHVLFIAEMGTGVVFGTLLVCAIREVVDPEMVPSVELS
jgi:hypothetical protein